MKTSEGSRLRSCLASMLLLWACRAEAPDPARDALAVVQRWAAAFAKEGIDPRLLVSETGLA